MNLLYIRILTTNKVKRAIKHVSNLFFAFLWRCHLNLQLPIWMGGIWLFCHTCHMHMWTSWGVYLMALLQMSDAHVNSSFPGGMSDGSVTNVICTCELQLVVGYFRWLCHKCHMYMWTAVVRGVSEGCHLKIWIHFGFDSCFTDVFSTKDQWAFNCNKFNIHSWSWNYHGCWHQMYPQINRSTWPKCWPNVKFTWCSTALGH